MNVGEILLLGLALSADAFSVTISNRFVYRNESFCRFILMPIAFGLFQGLMPVLGYYLGGLAAELIERYAGIVSFVILGIIGGNMVREGIVALRSGETLERSDKRLTIPLIFMQAVATAIDAFAVGVSLLAQQVNIVFAGSVIAITTFVCCVLALGLGKRFGALLGDKAEVVGGVVLIIIGVKALLT